MKVLEDVDASGVDPALWLFLGAIGRSHRELTQTELVVTSLRRPRGSRPSLHSPPRGEPVGAADLRRWALDGAHATEAFCKALQTRYGTALGVVLEPEWLTPAQLAERGGLDRVAPHIHVQLKARDWPRVL